MTITQGRSIRDARREFWERIFIDMYDEPGMSSAEAAEAADDALCQWDVRFAEAKCD